MHPSSFKHLVVLGNTHYILAFLHIKIRLQSLKYIFSWKKSFFIFILNTVWIKLILKKGVVRNDCILESVCVIWLCCGFYFSGKEVSYSVRVFLVFSSLKGKLTLFSFSHCLSLWFAAEFQEELPAGKQYLAPIKLTKWRSSILKGRSTLSK